jgi:hypothetical protein
MEGAAERLWTAFRAMGVRLTLRERTSPKTSSSRLKWAMIEARVAASSRCLVIYCNNCSGRAPGGRTSTECLTPFLVQTRKNQTYQSHPSQSGS